VVFNLETDGQGDNSDPADKTWVDARIVISPWDDTNEVGDTHVLEACVEVNDGDGWDPAPNDTVIDFTKTGVGTLSADNCTTSGDTGCCSVDLDSSTPGTSQVSASTTVDVGGESLSRSTDGTPGTEGGPAKKTWVDAYITIDPLTDTNYIGDDHPLTACVKVDDGSGWVAADNGTEIYFVINSGPGSLSSDNCTVTDGSGCCSVTLTSDNVGTTVIFANTTVSVAGEDLYRETDGEAPNSDPAEKEWIGGEGCTPGFWKNHPDCWEVYDNQTRIDAVFDCISGYGWIGEDTLMDALNYQGGKGTKGAGMILLRAAVAALLNISHPDIDYPQPGNNMTEGELIANVCAALNGEDRGIIIDLAEQLDDWNNAEEGCPIDAHCNLIDNEV